MRGTRVRRYVPLILWAAFIFFASTNSLSAPNTSRFVRPVLLWLMPHLSEAELIFAHVLIRKAAHFAEYAVLALFARRAFISSSRETLRRHWYAAAFLLVTICALLDEYHQSLIASRTGSIWDVLIDVAGGGTVIVICALKFNVLETGRTQNSTISETHGEKLNG